jgi:hypothetical protein
VPETLTATFASLESRRKPLLPLGLTHFPTITGRQPATVPSFATTSSGSCWQVGAQTGNSTLLLADQVESHPADQWPSGGQISRTAVNP